VILGESNEVVMNTGRSYCQGDYYKIIAICCNNYYRACVYMVELQVSIRRCGCIDIPIP
jgi:hypothetical protein